MQNLGPEHFYKKCTYNAQTKNQLWMSEIADSHDIWCSCDTPFAHLLSSIFPPDHKDRKLTIEQILTRDWQQCHSGGGEGESHGLPTDGGHTEEEKLLEIKEEDQDIIKDEDLQELIAAGEDAGTR